MGIKKDLVHYIISVAPKGEIGMVKLNKILWFIDTDYFREHGKSLTGVESYIKKPFGPTFPDLDSIIHDLVTEGKISIEPLQAIVKYDGSITAAEMVKDKTQEICNNYSAMEISKKSHGNVYRAATMHGNMPVYAILAENYDELTADDFAWADSVSGM